ncbi:hypothetical protein ACOSQ4_032407 [Xanthoceras sorbifolium]
MNMIVYGTSPKHPRAMFHKETDKTPLHPSAAAQLIRVTLFSHSQRRSSILVGVPHQLSRRWSPQLASRRRRLISPLSPQQQAAALLARPSQRRLIVHTLATTPLSSYLCMFSLLYMYFVVKY